MLEPLFIVPSLLPLDCMVEPGAVALLPELYVPDPCWYVPLVLPPLVLPGVVEVPVDCAKPIPVLQANRAAIIQSFFIFCCCWVLWCRLRDACRISLGYGQA